MSFNDIPHTSKLNVLFLYSKMKLNSARVLMFLICFNLMNFQIL